MNEHILRAGGSHNAPPIRGYVAAYCKVLFLVRVFKKSSNGKFASKTVLRIRVQ